MREIFGKGYISTRSYEVSENSIRFNNNDDFFSAPASSGITLNTDNSWCIPYKIIGYKE